MIDWLLEPLRQGIVVRGLGELVLIGVVSGGLGCWIVFSDLSYSAESLAHGMLPGLVAAGILGVPILLGGAVGLAVAAVAIALVARVPRLDPGAATSVVVTTLLGFGVLLGWALDRWLGTTPLLLFVFFMLGAAAGVLNAYRHLRRMQNGA